MVFMLRTILTTVVISNNQADRHFSGCCALSTVLVLVLTKLCTVHAESVQVQYARHCALQQYNSSARCTLVLRTSVYSVYSTLLL